MAQKAHHPGNRPLGRDLFEDPSAQIPPFPEPKRIVVEIEAEKSKLDENRNQFFAKNIDRIEEVFINR